MTHLRLSPWFRLLTAAVFLMAIVLLRSDVVFADDPVPGTCDDPYVYQPYGCTYYVGDDPWCAPTGMHLRDETQTPTFCGYCICFGIWQCGFYPESC
jgi:hypothetical protein